MFHKVVLADKIRVASTLKSPNAAVCRHVLAKSIISSESTIALLACEWALPAVDAKVCPQMTPMRKGALALVTLVRPLTSVTAHVRVEVALISVRLPALIAHKAFREARLIVPLLMS
jgi:hypothetical protein